MKDEQRPSDGQTISRAVMIMKALAEKPGASFGQVANMTGLPRSTVQRLIRVLNQEGLVTKAFGQQGAYLSTELARLGAKVKIEPRVLLKPLMEELHEEVGDNIDLTTMENGQVFVIEQIASNETIRVISFVGMQHPIHCTANGKAHLSMLEHAEALRLLGDKPRACTSRTRTDPKRIMAEIDKAREGMLFLDEEEYSEGACAIAVPLPRIGHHDLALSVAMPTSRFERLRDQVSDALLRFRAKVIDTYGSSI